jgi:hypothetical protein
MKLLIFKALFWALRKVEKFLDEFEEWSWQQEEEEDKQ